MKTKVALIIVILIALALGAGLITRNKQANEQHQKDADTIGDLSNREAEVSRKLGEQVEVNRTLEKDAVARKAEVVQMSNDLAQTTEKLTKTEADLKSAMEEAAKRDAKIAELENQKEALDKQAVDLRGSITQLEAKIADVSQKLKTSEGDKAFLEKELQRLMAEKAELERQFNDLAVLRAQVHKLKVQLSEARRLDWIRQGLFAQQDQKGAQRLMQFTSAGTNKGAANENYNLNVEVNADGSVRVIPPVTNAAPAPAPPK